MSHFNILLSASPIACSVAFANRQVKSNCFFTISGKSDSAIIDMLGYFKGRGNLLHVHASYNSAKDDIINKVIVNGDRYIETTFMPESKMIDYATNTVFDIIFMIDHDYSTPRLVVDGLTEAGIDLILDVMSDNNK